MIEIEDMREADAREVFGRIGFGHIAVAKDNMPYLVPIHYAFDGEHVFIYTTEGKKADIITVNPEVCLQAEEIESNEDWVSVMAFGQAEQITDEEQRKKALDLILEVNPRLTPAISIRWMDNWVRENIEVIYRIRPRKITGRRTVKRDRPSNATLVSPKTD